MKHLAALNLLLSVVITATMPAAAVCQSSESLDLSFLLPGDNHLESWKRNGETENAHGDDLYELINGGAELYHEYGFRRALLQTYSNPDGKTINVEIYEMIDSISAYGIFSLKIGDHGRELNIGTRAVLEDYYLNLWKGRFLVTLVGLDTHPDTIAGITALAEWITGKIPHSGRPPGLVTLITDLKPAPRAVKYFKGPLGLYNIYSFDSRDLFGLQEGIAAYFDRVLILVFDYPDAAACQHYYNQAAGILSAGPVYTDFRRQQGSLAMKDRTGKTIQIENSSSYITVVISEQPAASMELYNRVKRILMDRDTDPRSNGASTPVKNSIPEL